MRFRTRAFLLLLAAMLLPLAALGVTVRREMGGLIREEHADRRAGAVAAVRGELGRTHARTLERLDAIATDLAGDPRFRVAVETGEPASRAWLLDYAGGAMRAAGLDVLELRDAGGMVLSSGHFRNEYDRQGPVVPAAAAAAEHGFLLRARLPSGPLLSQAAFRVFHAGESEFSLVGGVALDSARLAALAPGEGLEVGVADEADEADEAVASIAMPLVDVRGDVRSGAIVVLERDDRFAALERRTDRWFLLIGAVTAGAALLLAAWLSSRMSAPLRDLSDKAAAIDLERLDQYFANGRSDEFGALADVLDDMTRRLRAGTARLREAERRAAIGDLSRQVTHDIKNGLAPIRHVVRHLSDVAAREPSELPAVFGERRGTLESSIAYLEKLAASYARISPESARTAADAAPLLRELAGSLSTDRIAVVAVPAGDAPRADADPVALRRIVENLAANAIESIEGAGTVTLASERAPAGALRITVSDTGRGMSRTELERAFDDFHTTKPGGTGLGLSVVRRLVADLGGSLQVATEPGRGTRFTIELPAHAGANGA
ncbi:MAG TPA: ATP-binding protein [Gemmatimonadales bacterium]